VIVAYLPSLLTGVARRAGGHGWQFQLALEVLQHLERMRATQAKGLSGPQLARLMQVDMLQLEPVLETLAGLDWVGQLTEADEKAEARYVLLADPDATPMEPLVQRLLLARADAVMNLWKNSQMSALRLRSAL
jgi:membrane protein